MKRHNPTRRGDIKTDGCKCGWWRKKQKWVRNGCQVHKKVATKE